MILVYDLWEIYGMDGMKWMWEDTFTLMHSSCHCSGLLLFPKCTKMMIPVLTKVVHYQTGQSVLPALHPQLLIILHKQGAEQLDVAPTHNLLLHLPHLVVVWYQHGLGIHRPPVAGGGKHGPVLCVQDSPPMCRNNCLTSLNQIEM
mmetsp:Transcript_1278/g.2603  ORF Transcript_1278/g.2603 Transcript_1278/m.2603 type:complete len:146 (-) Transcript_1278:444-881(-)